jgi:hypothetical protein
MRYHALMLIPRYVGFIESGIISEFLIILFSGFHPILSGIALSFAKAVGIMNLGELIGQSQSHLLALIRQASARNGLPGLTDRTANTRSSECSNEFVHTIESLSTFGRARSSHGLWDEPARVGDM